MVMISNEEAARLAALHSLHILDTPSQECFDRITGHCVQLFGCAVSLITLIDEDRQWFLSRKGLEVHETPRELSLCAHTMHSGETFLLPDAQADERFSANPLVSQEGGVRSYMGHPISNSEGELIGSLCVADPRPGFFQCQQRGLLANLAKTVEDLIEAHRQRLEAAALSRRLIDRSARLERSNRIFRQAEKTAKIGSWELEIETGSLSRS